MAVEKGGRLLATTVRASLLQKMSSHSQKPKANVWQSSSPCKTASRLPPPTSRNPAFSWLIGWIFGIRAIKSPTFDPTPRLSYERRIHQYIIPTLGNTQLDKLTTNDIQQFYTRLKQGGRLLRAEIYGEGLSDQTVRGSHTTLHAALDKAVSEKLLFRNPADGCRPPPAKAREMQVLTPEEIQRLLIQVKENSCFELLLLELSTGLRRGEICALQWTNLNLRTGELRVER